MQLALHLDGPAIAVAAGDGAVYASYLPHPNGTEQVVVRLDLSTGSVERSDALAGSNDDELAFAGSSLWVSGGILGKEKSRILYQLDAGTLAIVDRVILPAPPTALAVGPGGLWVGAGSRLLLLDPSDGSVLRSLPVEGEVGDLSVDPTGRLLYVSTHPAGDQTPLAITERDATSGGVTASVGGQQFGLAVNRLSATNDGVWVSYATGTLGSVVLLRASDLRQVASFSPNARPAGPNTVAADVAAGILWVPVGPSPGGFWCADPATGLLMGREGTTRTYRPSAVVAVPPDVYVGTGKALLRVTPSGDCVS